MIGRRVLAGVVVSTLAAGMQLVAGATASAAAVTMLYYSSAGAPDYVAEIDQAAANWNAAVTDVRLVKGGAATIVFHETDDGEGSYTSTDGHGHGQIYLDKQQVEEGFAPTRIAAHELGHNLGLPDHYTGPCSEVMSGHGPGTSCTNAVPDAAEAATVQQDWANGFAAEEPARVAY